jgi:disulfide bond formation protein DsbB
MTIPIRLAAFLLLLASLALLAGAFGFQYLGGLNPCVLCWWQRYAHFGAIVLAATTATSKGERAGAVLLSLTGLAFLVGAGIAAFHVGVEQHWWEGTSECGSVIGATNDLEAFRARILAQPVVRCDEVAWSMLGISMAGYNFLISLALAAFAGAVARRHLSDRAEQPA